MKDSTKRKISGATCILTMFYGVLAYMYYYLPWLILWLSGALSSLMANFILIPVAVVLAAIFYLVPLIAIVVFLGYFVDMMMHKILGIEFPY